MHTKPPKIIVETKEGLTVILWEGSLENIEEHIKNYPFSATYIDGPFSGIRISLLSPNILKVKLYERKVFKDK